MHESEDRPEGAGDAGGSPEEPERRDEDAAWREIVANFGPRFELSEGPEEPAGSAADDDEDDEPLYLEDTERYVPPEPPPAPRPRPPRALAWAGVLGTPFVAILLAALRSVTGIDVPDWGVIALVLAFLGGMGYLIATMPREPGDPWDDGARV